MIINLFIRATQIPQARKVLWKIWYQFLAGRYTQPDWSFMNYGFSPLDPEAPPLALEPADEADRHCIQLYHEVAGAGRLDELDVLEVGSGRGGGASYVSRYLKPKSMTGVDYSANAVALANSRFGDDVLNYVTGDAGNLPFPDGSFDLVINVESSHCYPSRPDFFREVHRVLRPGGRFRIADLFAPEELDATRSQLAAAGLRLASETAITPNVIQALDESHADKDARISKTIGGPLASVFRSFAGLKGSEVYEGFKSGRLIYAMFGCEKP